ERSAKSWSPETGHGEVALQMCALGAEAGTASLKEEPNFDVNPGLSSLVGSSEASHAYTVDVRRLDEVLAGEGKVGVMKLDVEDYEMEVLRGATALLASGSIRDIIYEDHNGYPSDLSSFLEGYGYKVFTIKREMLRPLLLAPEGSAAASLNFLATLDPERAKARFRRAGYSALRRKIR
ncbi:MAG TPA: FkbM family methyltransferase, partial [Fimbriimonadaceae bacterium]|nr:FkbM family methyltransferase [Fimbriimonadaceae bacterium]